MMAGYDWIGNPTPPDSGAPSGEGRKRYDPRAPGSKGQPITPSGPPVIELVVDPNGERKAVCDNGLPLVEGTTAAKGTADPGATVTVWRVIDEFNSQQVGSGAVNAAGEWLIRLSHMPEGYTELVATQAFPGSPPSVRSNSFFVMVDTCVQRPAPAPPVIDGLTGSSKDCGGTLLWANPVTAHGTGVNGATVTVYWASEGHAGTELGSAKVQGGTWSVKLHTLPNGEACITAIQRVPAAPASDPAAEVCFTVGVCGEVEVPPTEPTVDLDAHALRWNEASGWGHGTLAYKINGEYVYGVLRKVGG